jgi:hypothetical protein
LYYFDNYVTVKTEVKQMNHLARAFTGCAFFGAVFLALVGPSLLASSYTALPGTGGQVLGCITLTSGRPAIGVLMSFYVGPPGLKSGSHIHDTGVGRPNLVLNHTSGTTGADGCVSVDLIIPMFAGTYFVTVSGGGMSDRIVLTASVASMVQLNSPSTGLAPLSTYYDPGHGNEWMGKSQTNSKIGAIADAWQRLDLRSVLRKDDAHPLQSAQRRGPRQQRSVLVPQSRRTSERRLVRSGESEHLQPHTADADAQLDHHMVRI